MKTFLLYITILLVSISAYGQAKSNSQLQKNKQSYLVQNGFNGPVKQISKITYQGTIINNKHMQEKMPWRKVNYYFDRNGMCLKIDIINIENGISVIGATDSFIYNNGSIAYVHKEEYGPNEITYIKWIDNNTLSETTYLLDKKRQVGNTNPVSQKLTYYTDGQITLRKKIDLPHKKNVSIQRYHLEGNIITTTRKDEEWSPVTITISKDHYKNPTKSITIFDIPDSFIFQEQIYEYYPVK